jgi:hypothetical protein
MQIVPLVSRVPEIALRDHPKRTDRRQRSAILAVQFVPVITVDDDLAFESARQFETVEKHVARVAIARVSISFANVLVAVPRVVIARISLRCAAEFDPVDLKVARVLITVSRIIPTRVRHRPSSRSHETGANAGKKYWLGRDGRERRMSRRNAGSSDRSVRAWSRKEVD